MALETTNQKIYNRNFTVTGMSMSCLDRARTANCGYDPPWNYPGGVGPPQIVEGHTVVSTKWMGLETGISTK